LINPLVIPESRSDIRDPATLHFGALRESHWFPAFAGMTSKIKAHSANL
jgi:hypothetical protein